jgi:tRNA-binding EMAP/Myf-like protein
MRVLRGALRSSFAFRGVAVARVLSAGAHPKSASLAVVVVDAGGDRGGGLAAVCEAEHGLAAGDLVAFAPVGAELPSEELVSPLPQTPSLLKSNFSK